MVNGLYLYRALPKRFTLHNKKALFDNSSEYS